MLVWVPFAKRKRQSFVCTQLFAESSQRSLQIGIIPCSSTPIRGSKILFKPTLWMFQRAQSQLWQNPWKRQRSTFTKACRNRPGRDLHQSEFGGNKGTLKLPSTSKSLPYKELRASNTTSLSSAPDFVPSTIFVQQQGLEFTQQEKILPRAIAFHLPNPAPAAPLLHKEI